jgi:hypothetical protein
MTTTEDNKLRDYEQKYDICFEALPEDVRVRGNASACGDDALDKEIEDNIVNRLEAGDLYAWFTAKVSVRDDQGREASDYLGCCCYQDEKDFKSGGYYLDMVEECIRQLEMEDEQ